MKKLPNNWDLSLFSLKFTLKMKLTTFLIIITMFNVQANNYAQTKKITLNLNNVSINEALNKIEHLSEFKFLFNRKDIDVNKIINVKADKEKIKNILEVIFYNMNISFELLDKQIIITKGQNSNLLATDKSNQQTEISGTVSDNQGTPLPGASIIVKGSKLGASTDFDGKFTLLLPNNASSLIVSFIGYKTQEIAINNQDTFHIILIEDASSLDEVIVTGYTSERKSDLTGAVSIVKMDEVVNQPVSSVDNMLQGRVSGVNVVSSAAPGGLSSLRIRGFSTIRNNDPLYVIDGVPTTSGMNLVNPNDIESLQVLKDASSTSIYGSRAANGVVIITTKKGKPGEIKVSLNSYVGIQNIKSLPNNLTAQAYGDVWWQAFANDGISPSHSVYGNGASPSIPEFLDVDKTIPSSNTNWVSSLFAPATIQSYNLNISKGGDKSHSMFSLSYFDQEGTLKHTGFKRITARFNSDFKILNDKVVIGENLALAHSGTVGTSTNSLLDNAIYDAYRMPSIAPIYDINGDFTGYPLADVQNPLGKLYRNKDNKSNNIRVFGNLYTEINLLKDLKFKSNVGINYTTFKSSIFNPTYTEPNAHRSVNDLTITNRVNYDWVWTNTLNYAKTFNEKHTINVLLGVESVENIMDFNTASINDLPTNETNIRVLNAGDKGTQTNSGDKVQFSLFSYFGKLNYNYDNKYLFSTTIRRDGTSKLLNNRWGVFPAVSAGWKISNEDFFNKDGFLSDLKIRAGWGKTGNQDIPAYQTISGYSSNPYYSNYAIDGSQTSTQTGYTLSRINNPDLKWESTTQTNIGVDMKMLNNSINFTADYFVKNTNNLLLFKTLAPDQGITNRGQWQNVGEMQNKGVEFATNYSSNSEKEFKYNVGFNLSIIKNKLLSLGEGIDFIETDPAVLHAINFDQSTSRTAVGQSISSFYGTVIDGIFQTDAAAAASIQPNAVAGDFRFKDLNGDGKIDDSDRTFIGSPLPDFTYGINLSGSYKDFDFTMFFQGSQGNKIYDLSRYYSDFFDLSAYNKSSRILNAWSTQNTNTSLSRVSSNDLNNNIRPSTYYVQDGSYLRMKTLQIGYSFSENVLKKLNASKFRIYIEAHNLFTITNYKGLDPEIGLQNYTSDDRNLDIGVDRGVYPSSQTITLGVNLNF